MLPESCPSCTGMGSSSTLLVLTVVLLLLTLALTTVLIAGGWLLMQQWKQLGTSANGPKASTGVHGVTAAANIEASIPEGGNRSGLESQRTSTNSENSSWDISGRRHRGVADAHRATRQERQNDPAASRYGTDSDRNRDPRQQTPATSRVPSEVSYGLNENSLTGFLHGSNRTSSASERTTSSRPGAVTVGMAPVSPRARPMERQPPPTSRPVERQPAETQPAPDHRPSLFNLQNTAGPDAEGRASLWDIPKEVVDGLRRNRSGVRQGSVEVSRKEGFIESLQLGEKLGAGEFGTVFLCKWEGVQAAVKLVDLQVDTNGKTSSVGQFVQEAEVAALLRHPNVVQVFKVNIESRNTLTEDGSFKPGYWGAIVMEYCEMGSLADAIKSNFFAVHSTSSLVDVQRMLLAAEGIARGMLFLHNQDILHAHVKPSNVLLKQGSDGVVAKLTDFGMSVQMSVSQTHVSQHQTGTLDHMAPEVLMEGKSSKRSDVYSFGILMWELFCCARPYDGLRDLTIVQEVVEQDMRPQFPKSAPREYVALAAACWQKDPQKRPVFSEIVARLEQMNLILNKLLSTAEEPGHVAGLSEAGEDLTEVEESPSPQEEDVEAS